MAKGHLSTEAQWSTASEVVLGGVSICPGIAIRRAQLVDAELPAAGDKIESCKIKAEQKRYARAVKETKERLHRVM